MNFIKPVHIKEVIQLALYFVLISVPTSTPQNLTITEKSSNSLRLEWNQPSERNGNITAYSIVVISLVNNISLLIKPNTTSYTLSSLRPYTRYTCSIAAHTAIGRGPFSMPVTVMTPEDAPEAPPFSIAYDNLTSYSVRLSWRAPPKDMQNGIIRQYYIEVHENITGKRLTYQTPSHLNMFVITNLHPFYHYTAKVRAMTTGPGPFSSPVTFQTAEDSKQIKYLPLLVSFCLLFMLLFFPFIYSSCSSTFAFIRISYKFDTSFLNMVPTTS